MEDEVINGFWREAALAAELHRREDVLACEIVHASLTDAEPPRNLGRSQQPIDLGHAASLLEGSMVPQTVSG